MSLLTVPSRTSVSDMATQVFKDFQGTRIWVGNIVASTAYGYGTPKGADSGQVVGFGRTKVRVAWDGYVYDADVPYHSSRPGQLRVTKGL